MLFKKKKQQQKRKPRSKWGHRQEVLKWGERFAKYYASQNTVDPRAIPTQIPLGRLLVIIDRYLANGIEGIANAEVADLIARTEGLKSQIQTLRGSLDLYESSESVPVENSGI